MNYLFIFLWNEETQLQFNKNNQKFIISFILHKIYVVTLVQNCCKYIVHYIISYNVCVCVL